MDNQHSRPPLSTSVSSQRANRTLVSPPSRLFFLTGRCGILSSGLSRFVIPPVPTDFIWNEHPVAGRAVTTQWSALSIPTEANPFRKIPLSFWLRTWFFFYHFGRKDTWTELFRLALFSFHVNSSPTLIPKTKEEGWRLLGRMPLSLQDSFLSQPCTDRGCLCCSSAF